jgi:hypothetical protein
MDLKKTPLKKSSGLEDQGLKTAHQGMINTFRKFLKLKRAFAFDKHFEQIEGISRVP